MLSLTQIIRLLFVISVTRCSNNVNVVIIPPDVELAVGSSVTLTCQVELPAELQITDYHLTWQHPSTLNDDSTFDINEEHFTITSVSENNIGEYSCFFIKFANKQMYKGTGKSKIAIKAERPGQPQKLHVSGFSEDTVTLAWEAGFWGYADTLYYRLEYMREDSNWMPWREDIKADVVEYTATQLPLEKSYMFRISQVNKAGESYPSDPTSPVYLAKTGAVTVSPILERVEQYNSTAIRVIWRMPAIHDLVTDWFVEFRPKDVYKTDTNKYKAVSVPRDEVSKPTEISIISGLEEATTYQIRMYCRNHNGRGPPSVVKEIVTNEAAPSAPPSNVRSDVSTISSDGESKIEIELRWSPPPPKDANGQLTGYMVKIFYTDPQDEDENDTTSSKDAGVDTIFAFTPDTMPCWVAVAAQTSEGTGPFSNFRKVILPIDESASGTALDEVMALFKQPWIIALIGAFVLILIVMISIIVCRQQKIKRRKMQQQQHNPFFSSYQGVNGQCRMSRDDGPQYEKISDSGTTTPHGSSRSFDGRMFDNRGTPDSQSALSHSSLPPDAVILTKQNSLIPSVQHSQVIEDPNTITGYNQIMNSFIDNRIPPPNYCPSNLSMDSQRYSMSQNSSIDDLASTIPSVTYSIPHNRDGYKVVNPTANERNQQDIPVAKVPPKAKEQDPNAVKPKVYGNVTVKEWRERQLRKKPRGDGNSDTSLLSSFGKDSGRGSTDNVSVSASDSEGSDIEKYLEEEDFSPRNSGYIEDDLIDVARMGMSTSPPEERGFMTDRSKHHPPVAAETSFRADDAASIESDQYMQCEASPETSPPTDIYNLNGGVSDEED